MERSKRAYWVLGAALLALIAVCVYVFVVSNGKDAEKAQTTVPLDETGQSPPIHAAYTTIGRAKTEASTSEESEKASVQESMEPDQRNDE